MPNSPFTSAHFYLLCLVSVIAGVGYFGLMIFSYMTDIISQLFFIDSGKDWLYYTQMGGLLIASFMMMPLGGLLIGRYGDTHGRHPALLLSLLGMGVFTFLLGLLPTSEQIGVIAPLLFIFIKIGQSLAFGGLIPAVWVFASEHLPKRSLGFGFGVISACGILAILALLGVLFILENTSTQEQMLGFVWRVPFLLAGAIGLGLVFLTYQLDETPVFLTAKKETAPSIPDKELTLQSLLDEETGSGIFYFLKKHMAILLPAVTLSWLTASLVIIVALLLPNLINSAFVIEHGVLRLGSIICLVFMMLGCMVFGFMADYSNAGKVMLFGGTFFVVQISLFFGHLISGGELILVFFALLGFGTGIIAVAPTVIVQLFNTKHRLSYVAAIYSSMYAIASGVLPFALGYATFYMRMAPALYLTLVVVMTIFISFYLYHLPYIQKPKQDIYHEA